jgi:integrase
MGVYIRPDSPFFWMLLERPGQPPLRRSTAILRAAPTPALRKDNERGAWEIYNAAMTELARHRYQLPTSKPARTFRDHLDWYADTVSVTKSGERNERSILRQLLKFAPWATKQLQDVTRQDAMEWRAWRATLVEESTVNRELALLKHVFTAAVPTYLTASPLVGLSQLRPDEVDIRILSVDEETALLTPMPDRVHDVEERTMIVCALDTLQRLGSVTTLTWSHDKGVAFRILNAKVRSGSGHGLEIPISIRLRIALDALASPRGPCAPIFPFAASENPQRRRMLVWRFFRERCDVAGIKTNRLQGGASFHCLRHTGATRMLAAGTDPHTIMKIGGWKRLEQVLKYMHSNRDAQVAAVNTVGRGVRVVQLVGHRTT